MCCGPIYVQKRFVRARWPGSGLCSERLSIMDCWGGLAGPLEGGERGEVGRLTETVPLRSRGCGLSEMPDSEDWRGRSWIGLWRVLSAERGWADVWLELRPWREAKRREYSIARTWRMQHGRRVVTYVWWLAQREGHAEIR